jgi:serine/threonine protein kinase
LLKRKLNIDRKTLGAGHITAKEMQSISGQIYTIDSTLGEGAYSDVFSVRCGDDKTFAFKRFKREGSDLELGVLREISVLQILKNSHGGLINLLDTILLDDDEQTFGVIVPKYSTDLHTAIKDNTIPVAKRRPISLKLAETVHFLHSNNIIHRDIKPENILLDANMVPVLADYTLAKVFTGPCTGRTHTPSVGTTTYRAPEVVAKSDYGMTVDIWSLGIVFLELFTNELVDIADDVSMLAFVASKIPMFTQNKLGDMVTGMLSINPEPRLTAKEVLSAPFFKSSPISPVQESKYTPKIGVDVTPDVIGMCENFEVQREITKKAAQVYVSSTGCSVQSAVELACKFYEAETFEIENEDYPEEEMQILMKMGYNLFV